MNTLKQIIPEKGKQMKSNFQSLYKLTNAKPYKNYKNSEKKNNEIIISDRPSSPSSESSSESLEPDLEPPSASSSSELLSPSISIKKQYTEVC